MPVSSVRIVCDLPSRLQHREQAEAIDQATCTLFVRDLHVEVALHTVADLLSELPLDDTVASRSGDDPAGAAGV